jgi:myo-inositol-1(or 4)-monophosphatase
MYRVSCFHPAAHCAQVTEAVYYEDIWQQLQSLHTTFTRDARGVRMSGAAAANLCHLAMGVVDVYYQFNLKPW